MLLNTVVELTKIHNSLELKHGDFAGELVEQLLCLMYIGPEKDTLTGILEIGGYLGRTSCVISRLLGHNRLVVIEPNKEFCDKLIENRDHNKLNFHIENTAISKVPMKQLNFYTVPESVIQYFTNYDEWKSIDSLTWTELKGKYDLVFDVLVVDGEGALYHIMKDEPTFFENFRLVIIENDHQHVDHKKEIDETLIKNNFQLILSQYGPDENWILNHSFYEVWKK